MNRNFAAVLFLFISILAFATSRPRFELVGLVERDQLTYLSTQPKNIEKRGGGDCGFHDNCDRKRGDMDEEFPEYDLRSSNIIV